METLLSTLHVAGRRSMRRSIETKQKWNFLLLASVTLSLCSRRISSESSDGNAARIITLQRKYAYANFGIDEQGEEGG